MKKLITLIALSTLGVVSMAQNSTDSTNTTTIFASTCYNSSAVFNGKDESCYLFANPPTYWLNASQSLASDWSLNKTQLKMWMGHYIDFQNAQYQFFSQNVPYINGKCIPKPVLNASMPFDNSNNPDGFPLPATKINKLNSLSTYWKAAWDADKVTGLQVINNLKVGNFLFEVYAFYNTFYGNTSSIRIITQTAHNLGLQVDLATNRTYLGPSKNYLPT